MTGGGRRRAQEGQWLRVAGKDVKELTTPSMPEPENPDGWDPVAWGKRPDAGSYSRWYDPDRAWHEDDWEWSPNIDERRRAQIAGRKVQAAHQRDDRDERERVKEAIRRVLEVEQREQREVWRTWVLKEVKLTQKQSSFLRGEVQLRPNARSQMMGRIHERVRISLTPKT